MQALQVFGGKSSCKNPVLAWANPNTIVCDPRSGTARRLLLSAGRDFGWRALEFEPVDDWLRAQDPRRYLWGF
jgi:hypothetical protein